MPNHVYSQIAFSNLSEEQIQKLHEISKTHNGICGYYRPMPDDIRNTTSPARVVSETEYKKIMKENAEKKLKYLNDKNQEWYHESFPITKKMQKALFEKYDVDNWYDWAYNNWGTKWGCYDQEIDGETLHFSTAWSLFELRILDEVAKDFPDFVLTYEEEQGWGGEIEYVDGMCVGHHEYDAPEWSDTGILTDDGMITKLHTEIVDGHFNEPAQEGYYYDFDTSSPVSESTLKEYKLN